MSDKEYEIFDFEAQDVLHVGTDADCKKVLGEMLAAHPDWEGTIAIREFGTGRTALDHDCDENPVPVQTGGPLGHGWRCGVCGKFLQAG